MHGVPHTHTHAHHTHMHTKTHTINQEIFVLKIFDVINFRRFPCNLQINHRTKKIRWFKFSSMQAATKIF